MTPRRKWRVLKVKLNAKSFCSTTAALFVAATLLCSAAFTSCKSASDKPVIIWTSCPQFASYVELFNASQNKAKAVVVYKEQPARSLPPAKDEEPPDIVIGPWLKNSNTRKYFTPVDYLFSDQQINKSIFYPQLIEYGDINEKQYLLPVNFNLPAMIFDSKNERLMPRDHLISMDEIKTVAGNFNDKNKSDTYTSMGFGPSWEKDFLYLAAKLNGTTFREKGSSFSYEQKGLLTTVTYVREWTKARNTDTASEQNFQFKYLYMPEYKQISSGRCLFAYMTSNELFSLSNEQQSGISFRWIEQDGKVPVEDELITMGLYKGARNVTAAETFMSWFMKESTQEALLKHTADMKLDDISFGITGGFSSIRSVNEKVYPMYYRQLLGNLPSAEYLTTPSILPYRWPSLKARVIIPYLTDSTNTSSNVAVRSLEDRIAEWSKQYF
jgi:ABC-type glycerol-3-phosphate transport system substrate-binding protein